jgi:hypothetical protein
MTINLNIKADIIDIRNDTPQQDDIFLVDTNVWIWQTYTNAGFVAKPYQLNYYPKAGQIKIITDDIDYAVVPDIQIFTSNDNIIRLARTQKRLVRR